MKKVLHGIIAVFNIPAFVILLPIEIILSYFIVRSSNNELKQGIKINKFYKKYNLEIQILVWFTSICFYSWLIFR